MRPLGRLLQFVGLSLPPLAIALQLSQNFSLRDMLLALVFAGASFYLGRLIEGYAAG